MDGEIAISPLDWCQSLWVGGGVSDVCAIVCDVEAVACLLCSCGLAWLCGQWTVCRYAWCLSSLSVSLCVRVVCAHSAYEQRGAPGYV